MHFIKADFQTKESDECLLLFLVMFIFAPAKIQPYLWVPSADSNLVFIYSVLQSVGPCTEFTL